MSLAEATESAAWSSLSDTELLKLRFRELKLRPSTSPVWGLVEKVRHELRERGLLLDPVVYFGDEWFSPEGEVAIAVPFYLAHPRLAALQKAQLLEAEGDHPEMFLRLFRHELGHCFDHAFRVSKRARWKRIFGPPDLEYAPENYRPRPYSRSFVRHLPNWYAQAHPDEDFAETFAVWLDPDSKWSETYRRWPLALEKLRYVDSLAKEFRDKPVAAAKPPFLYDVARLSSQLETHYRKHRRENAQDLPDFFDPDLRRLFPVASLSPRSPRAAARFLRQHREEIIDAVHDWTRERKILVSQLLRRIEKRCEELGLGLGEQNEVSTSLRVASFVSATVLNFLFTGRFKRSY